MSKEVANVNPKLPAAIQKLVALHGGEASYNELAGGVVASFPIIGYRGKVWRIKKGGEEHDIVDDEGDPRSSIEVVLVKSNPLLSKIYYENDYVEGSNERPNCWSADGVAPDAGVAEPVSKKCATCPNNIWGSKTAQNGNKTKKCQDNRRIVVTSAQELAELGDKAPLYLLRTPPATLNPLKDYAEKVLKPKGIPYFAVTTKLGFDKDVAYPKITFLAKRFLTDEEAEAIIKLRDSEDARRILAESEEYGAAGTPTGSEASPSGEEAEDTGAPAASSHKKPTKPAKPRPAEEEDVGLGGDDEEAAAPPAKAPKKAAATPAPVEEDDESEIEQPPAKPVKTTKAPAKAAPAPVEEDEDEAPPAKPTKPAKAAAAAPAEKKTTKPAPKGDDEDFDGMLDSILNN